ncbi:hypothetical protein G6F57_015093 [Rhizopus arrhizus]|uniref:Uncharacterized protein n=1 Tax=Rhizopus oryzae TaxID=64495 RepID=A0A9P7BKY4_RHIOR|nr:hypothetical protein G6F30_012863 [Rhizopus arrhizus]KAG0973388.1 hypothetical protein G6F29_012869 [Rhizopus arrhizus]KAG0975771.1 hypothetical protein G6F28_012830 [Rhizopus arrhizus]KAG1001441.1 hypothetical protein G6F27_012871 [Rhizopus arrhizus]KAG1016032.1 hypothetical protein G6F26_012831 [Rhizopus arrhizus]
MEHEEEEDHADLGVGIGHAVTLFNLEVEDEAPQLPTTNHLSLIRQPNQNPTTANNNIYSPSTTNNKTTTSSQNYTIPQDGLLPGGRLGNFTTIVFCQVLK